MSLLIFDDQKLSKTGGRKYPASEYSDRVMNLNRLEDRNYENQCRLIEKERRTVMTSLNREMKLIESDLEDKQDLVRALYSQQKLSLLSTFPYKFSVGNQRGSSYIEELEKLGLAHDKTESLKLPQANRMKKVHSANGRLGGDRRSSMHTLLDDDTSARSQRPASAIDNYHNAEIKPILSNRGGQSNVQASKRDVFLKKPSSDQRSMSINDLRRSSEVVASDSRRLSTTYTPKLLPAVMPAGQVVQVRPRDLKIIPTTTITTTANGKSGGSDESVSASTSTESFQIVRPSSGGALRSSSTAISNPPTTTSSGGDLPIITPPVIVRKSPSPVHAQVSSSLSSSPSLPSRLQPSSIPLSNQSNDRLVIDTTETTKDSTSPNNNNNNNNNDDAQEVNNNIKSIVDYNMPKQQTSPSRKNEKAASSKNTSGKRNSSTSTIVIDRFSNKITIAKPVVRKADGSVSGSSDLASNKTSSNRRSK